MAQPSAYNRVFNFSNFQAANPEQPLPAGSLDEELSRIKAVFDQIRSNLALIQRDDTALANDSVGFDQLKSEISIGVNPPTTWVTSTSYIVRDSVFHAQKFYVALESHVSGTFDDDLAAGKWDLVADFTAAQAASLVTYDNSTSGLLATDMQAAMDELVASVNVTSVFGRSGAVVAAAGDYTAAQVTFTPAGNIAATTVQAAIAELDSETDASLAALDAGKADVSHTHPQSDITNLVSDLAGKVPTTRSVSAAGLATGGGDLSASRTIAVTEASQAEAEAGTASNVAMTPRRVKNALDARVYTGSTRDETDFPVGHQIACITSSFPIRNAAASPRLDADGVSYTTSGAGTLLSGTWRSRGPCSSSHTLLERVS